MKLSVADGKARPIASTKRTRAFTIAEMMVTGAIFSMLVLAMVYTQLFGLTQDKLVQSKLGASDQSRKAFDLLARDIRSAKSYTIGDISSGTNFTATADGSPQRGSAVKLCLSTNVNIYIVYFFDTVQGELRRFHSGSATTLIAKNLTNSIFFTNSMTFMAENPNGTIQTDRSHKGVIHATLCFWQYQFPRTLVGFGNYYDYYKMEFKLSPHVPDGP